MRLALSFTLAAVLAGCYAPDLPDCAVTCAKNDDCSGDQVCNDQGRCAAAGQSCNAETVDGGTGATDDAGSAARMVMLEVDIMGEGKVTVTNVGNCTAPAMLSCKWMVPAGRYQITATPTKPDKPFEKWVSVLCAGQAATCNTDVVLAGSVVAKFH
ncbi:MAG TPA: hypothetical protein VGM90_32140 [Kofleriaceae bacterium]|jgi:hypothetical protein